MPVKGKKKDLSQVRYVSMADFYQNIDDYKTLDGKLEYATRYILNHDMGMDKDYAFEGVVNLARQKIAEVMNHSPAERANIRARMFLGNPAGYLKGEANKLAKELDEADINYEGDDALKENCKNIANMMNDDFNAQVFEVDKVSKSIALRSKVEASFGGKQQLADNLKTANSHKWYAIFSSSSKQWKELEEAYENYNNPNKEEYGDDHLLYNSAIHYLQHKVPNWQPNQPFPQNAFAKFNESETAKVNFSLSVFKTVQSQLGADEKFHELVDENKGIDVKYEDLPEKQNNVIDLDQLAFQQKLKEDVDIENDSIVQQMDESMDIGLANEKDEPYIKVPEAE